MQIWLSTTDVDTVKKGMKMGIVGGVTTNLSTISQSKKTLEDLIESMLHAQQGPVAVQVSAEKAREMIHQGEALYAFSNRIIIKIPVTAEGIEAIYAFMKWEHGRSSLPADT